MKRSVVVILFLFLCVVSARAQTGAIAPTIYPVFFNSNGITPTALGFVCTTGSGGTTPLATYQDSALATPNQNPIRLNATGRAVNGSALVAIYLQASTYRFTLYAAGTGNTCNGTTVGASIWQQDGISDLAQLATLSFATKLDDLVCHASQYSGATEDAKISACISALPSTGGTIDVRGLQGSQSWAACPFTGITKPVVVIHGVGTTALAVSCTVPANVTLQFSQGSILSPSGGDTLTINGTITAPSVQIFAGAGSVAIANQPVRAIWFPGTENGVKVSAAITALPATGGVIDAASGMLGAQTMSTQVVIAASDITVQFGCATWTLSGVSPSQGPPFIAANFQVNGGHNVWFRGTRGCTTLKLAAGETSNVFTFFSNSVGVVGGGITDIEGDGNKAGNTSGSDDTFQSFVQIINGAGATADSQITVAYDRIHDFNHYGIVTYGSPYASGNRIFDNLIYSNGKNDAQGTGDGIYINLGSSRNDVHDNYSYSNQRNGIEVSTAGAAQADNSFVNNWLFSNGFDGIKLHEEANLGSLNSVCQTRPIIKGNHVYSNTQYGIRLTLASNVGCITGAVIEGNEIAGNTDDGILLLSNATPVVNQNAVAQTTIIGNNIGNTGSGNGAYGIEIGANALDTLIGPNGIAANTSGQISDSGTNTQTCGSKLGAGANTFACGAATFTGLVTATNVFVTSGGNIQWNQNGVRTWPVTAAGGNLSVASGDGLGALNVTAVGGLISAGPVQPVSVTYANRPGNGTLASVTPTNGMIISITDSTTVTWGATIAGGGVNQVLAWYNSGTLAWTVVGK